MIDVFTTSDGATLAYSAQGAGLPLLCLAGLTRTMADFDYVAPHLKGVQIIRMDYRGRGGSQWTGAASYTVPQEAKDALELLDHLGLGAAAILGTSRGGLIGMYLAAVARDRLIGLCLNDVGPQIERAGLERIKEYVGHDPAAASFDEMAAKLPYANPGFANVPPERWRAEVEKHFLETPKGLKINYDPALRQAFLAALDAPSADAWPLFGALQGTPIALIRGANSDLLSDQTAARMQDLRPDMLFASVPDRGHVPFLDEPESLNVIFSFLKALA